MKAQSFKNHSRFVPGYHFFLLPILLALFVCFCSNMCNELHEGEGILESLSLVLLSFSTLLAAFYGRYFAIKAQDRVIRTEENFRHFMLTGKPLQSELRLGQVIGLRFASDEEFPSLAQKAVAESLTKKQIKELIQNWRADNHRV
jgi:hypothetical protein